MVVLNHHESLMKMLAVGSVHGDRTQNQSAAVLTLVHENMSCEHLAGDEAPQCFPFTCKPCPEDKTSGQITEPIRVGHVVHTSQGRDILVRDITGAGQ